MSDNFLITQGSGTTIATHQNIDGSHEQKIQVTVAANPSNLDVALSTRTKPSDTQLVDGSAHTQPVSGSISVVNFPATQPISGSVSVSNFPVTQPISGAVSISNFPANQLVSVDRSNRTLVMKTGTLVTTAVTSDQVILTYTVTTGKTFFLTYISSDVRLTVVSATASILGTISLESPAGTKLYSSTETNPTTSQTGMRSVSFSEPMPIPSGTVIRFVTTPAAATSMTWIANFGGFEA